MKLKYLLFIFLLGIGIFAPQNTYAYTQQAATDDGYIYHTVVSGETIYSIASKYNVLQADIYSLNPNARRGIKPKQVLKIKTGKTYILHSVQPKETLYSVSKYYNVPIEKILEINPGLTSDNFKIGTAIKIPQGETGGQKEVSAQPENSVSTDSRNSAKRQNNTLPNTHTVRSGETLYSISKQYGVSMQELAEANPQIEKVGLKEGMNITIPRSNTNRSTTVSERPDSQATRSAVTKTNAVKVGLLLPFLNTNNNQQARFVEYYEGFLLAVEDLKTKGYSTEVYVFDIRKGKDTKKLESLLETSEMKALDLIIGGVNDDEVALLSKFAQKYNIKYAVPFPTKNDKVIKGGSTYQANVSQATLYPKVAEKFKDRFKDHNIIIVSNSSGGNDKSDFINMLKNTLDKDRIYYVSSGMSQSDIKNALSETKQNVIIPASSSLSTLGKLIPILRELKSNHTGEFTLFGYPDWQAPAYVSQYAQEFSKYNTYIYTPFYSDRNNPKTKEFGERYKKWYDKSLISTYPQYGLLGYDTALYFLNALALYPDSFDSSIISQPTLPILQSAFYFEEVPGKAGYVNTGVFFIHYNANMSTTKIDLSR